MPLFTTNYKTGDVIHVVYFENEENKDQGTARWLICLEDLGDKIVAVPLTKNTSQLTRYPKSFIITKDSEDGLMMGLLYDSLVIPSRVATIKKVQAHKNGSCSEDLLDKLIELVK
jgi:hypothetical protein